MAKKSKLGLGLVVGAVAGAVAGLFMAPKAGKELRKDAKKLSTSAQKAAKAYYSKLEGKNQEEVAKIVFGDVSTSSKTLMKKAHKDLSKELAVLNEKYKTIDKAKYSAAVKTVVDGLRADGELPKGSMKTLAQYLEKDAKKLVSRPTKKAPAKKKTAAKKKAPTKKS